jgi:zinc and cadmium transporter
MIVLYFILFITVIGSGCLIFVFKTENQKVLKLMLAFSGAFLIGISFFKLVPEVFSTSVRFAGLFVMAGFVIQLLLELITEGVEHGHSHEHHENEKVSPFILLIGLSVHAFLEGTPLVTGVDKPVIQSLVTGIIIHNIPISLTLMSLFLHYGCSRPRAIIYLSLFAIMTPFGSIIGNLVQVDSVPAMQHFSTYSIAVVIGIFLHVSTSILFETEQNHQYNIQKFVTILLGIAISFLLTLF